ncbi:MAG: hypothetical protein H7223_04180 [Pedobacter sp.]|nr:hypothetical protein [Pedobacter sp.]
MTEQEKNNSFNWIYYVLGLFFGILTTSAITLSFGWLLFGGLLGFMFGAIFLNSIVKDRQY